MYTVEILYNIANWAMLVIENYFCYDLLRQLLIMISVVCRIRICSSQCFLWFFDPTLFLIASSFPLPFHHCSPLQVPLIPLLFVLLTPVRLPL